MDDQPYFQIRDPGPNPESALAMSEDQQKIRSLLNVLSDTDRAAVIMFYWYEFSYEEIANSLGLSISAVKSRLHRARSRLAKTFIDRKQSVAGFERQTYGSPAI
jgi:RNA polymerase sigma-70 factor (ECF subfamily)